MSLNEWYEKGITTEEYTKDLDKHREGFYAIYNQFKVPEIDIKKLQEKSHLRVIALAEVWCGHCMMDIAILLKMLEKSNIPIRFLRRDEHLELMDQYLTNNKRYIPIFIFIDEEGNEVAKWGPMAPEVEEFVNELKQGVPEKDSPEYESAWKNYIEKTGHTFKTDAITWQAVYEDILQTLTNDKHIN